MAHYIYIHTDNNRIHLHVGATPGSAGAYGQRRLVYLEIHETEAAAAARLCELRHYTRMQLERLVRRSNPNWLNLELRQHRVPYYHPGAKLSPNVPNRTSLR